MAEVISSKPTRLVRARKLKKVAQQFAAGSCLFMLLSLTLVFTRTTGTWLAIAIFGLSGLILLWLAWRMRFRNNTINLALIWSSSIVTNLPLLQHRMLITHDLDEWHLFFLNEFDRIIRMGEFYPRRAESFNFEHGNPVFNFLPPAWRYFAESFHLLGLTFTDSLNIVLALSAILSGHTMYLFARTTLKPGYKGGLGALLAGMAYLYFPFRISEAFQRGAIGPTVFCAIAPLFLLTSYNLLLKGSSLKRWLSAVTVFGMGLLIYHLQIVLIGLFGGGWLAFILGAKFYQRRFLPKDSRDSISWQFKQILWLCTAVVFGLALGAVFWLPAFTEKDSTLIPYFTLYLDRDFAYSTQNLTLFPLISVRSFNTNWIGLNQIVLAVTVGYIFLRRRQKINIGQNLFKAQTFYFMMAIVLILFIQAPVFYDAFVVINRYLPLEFPSRLLVSGGIASAWLMGLLPQILNRKWLYPRVVIALFWILVCGTTNLEIYQFPEDFDDNIPYEVLSSDVNRSDISYLPATMNKGWEEVQGSNAPINLAADGKIQSFIQEGEPNPPAVKDLQVQKGVESYNIRVTVDQATEVFLPPFYYPAWVVNWVHDRAVIKTLPTYPSEHISLLTVDLPAAGVYELELRYEDTPAVTIGSWSSLISWFIWVCLVVIIFITSLKKSFTIQPRLELKTSVK